MNDQIEGTPLNCADCGAPVSMMHRKAGYRLTRCRQCSALLHINSERTATKVMKLEQSGLLCPLCTYNNPDNQLMQQFCNNCSAALKKPCRACGQAVALIDNFCGRCRADQQGASGPAVLPVTAATGPVTIPGPVSGILPPHPGSYPVVPVYPSLPQPSGAPSRVMYSTTLGIGPQVYSSTSMTNANPMQASALTFAQSAQANTLATTDTDPNRNIVVEGKRQKAGHAAIAAGTVSGIIALLNVGTYGYSSYGYYSAAAGAHAFWNVIAAGFLFLTVCLMTYRARLGVPERGIKVYDSTDASLSTTINPGKQITRPFQTPMGLTATFLGGMGLVIGMMTGGLSGIITAGMIELFFGGGFLVFAFIAAWLLKQLGLND